MQGACHLCAMASYMLYQGMCWHTGTLIRPQAHAPAAKHKCTASLPSGAWRAYQPCSHVDRGVRRRRSCQAASSSAPAGSSKGGAAYQVLLLMASKLHALESMSSSGQSDGTDTQSTDASSRTSTRGIEPSQQAAPSEFDKLIAARPELISMSFLLWLAEQEAAASGHVKQRLSALCQRLVLAREVQEQVHFKELHANTVELLAGQMQHPQDAASTAVLPAGQPQPQGTSDVILISDSTHIASLHLSASSPPGQGQPHPNQTQEWSNGEVASSPDPRQPGWNQLELQHAAGCEAGTADSHSSSSAQSVTHSNTGAGTSAQLAVLQDPVQYAVKLAEAVTGAPVVLSGYDWRYDLVAQAAPPAALSPEGLAQAHAQARELSEDLQHRRKRSVASILGRVKVAPEQQAQLMAGSAVARILDLLLSLPDTQQRAALLPDCFTPPSKIEDSAGIMKDGELGGGVGEGDHSTNVSSLDPQQLGQGVHQTETDELWCTPAQLLSEIDARVRAVKQSGGAGLHGRMDPSSGLLLAAPGQLVGPQLVTALVELREHVKGYWMQGLVVGPANGSLEGVQSAD